MSARGAEARRRALRAGATAEWVAAALLMAKGYRLLARRYGGRGGEIDLIVARGDIVAFVEVKARASVEDAMLAITPQKRRLFARAARRWLAANRWAMDRTLRADAVFLAPWRMPRHLADAFPLGIG